MGIGGLVNPVVDFVLSEKIRSWDNFRQRCASICGYTLDVGDLFLIGAYLDGHYIILLGYTVKSCQYQKYRVKLLNLKRGTRIRYPAI